MLGDKVNRDKKKSSTNQRSKTLVTKSSEKKGYSTKKEKVKIKAGKKKDVAKSRVVEKKYTPHGDGYVNYGKEVIKEKIIDKGGVTKKVRIDKNKMQGGKRKVVTVTDSKGSRTRVTSNDSKKYRGKKKY